MLTTAAVFLDTLVKAGVTHAFVNWGNDHPAFLEELERQRVETGNTSLEIITSPNEMVALSAAQGLAQVTGTPTLVIVHVDVGTQALAGAVHNVDRGRAPVIIFAGMAPHSGQGELKGSKNEWPMWPQDVPDQAAIVRQYMRHTNQIMSGRNVSKTVMRAFQFAVSEPKGPVYLSARREVLEEELDPTATTNAVDLKKWPAISPTGLSPDDVTTIIDALISAEFPLVLGGNSGRNPKTVPLLTALSEKLGIALFGVGCASLAIPYDHPHFLGMSFAGKNPVLPEADVVILLDTEVPWIDTWGNAPKPGAKVFVLDPDPLKQTYGWSHVDADLICRTDVEVALSQLLVAADGAAARLDASAISTRSSQLSARHDAFLVRLAAAEGVGAFKDPEVAEPAFILATLREAVAQKTPNGGARTLWLNEGISNYAPTWDHIRPSIPGSMLCSGGSSLGWAMGAAIGISLGRGKDYDLIVAVVGDGSYLFGVPSSAYWMARRYNAPFLTIILNNGGWASPRNSMLGIYPAGLGSKAPGSRLSVGFGPDMPDYSQIAVAAGGAWGRRVSEPSKFKETFEEAIQVILQEKRCAVIDCIVPSI